MRLVAEDPLDFAPGTRCGYNNTSYVLLGMLIEHHRESLPHLALWVSLCCYVQEDTPYLLRQLKPYGAA